MLDQWLQVLEQNRAIAIIRCPQISLAYKMAVAVAAGGMNLIEITWNRESEGKTDQSSEDLITQLRTELPHCTIGAGTILNSEQLEAAVNAGAQFAFSPYFSQELLDVSQSRYQIPFVPGVFSPTEIVNAWQSGAKVVKVFPIKSLGGAEYIRCLQGPLSQIPLIPTGGITLENASKMIEAGAIAVGISSSLFPTQAIANQDWSSISLRTKYLLDKLQGIKK